MHVSHKFWFILLATSLGLAFIACFCPALTPTPMPVPTPPARQTAPVSPATQPPAGGNPLTGLAGYWQEGSRIFSIQWQGGKYLVTGVYSPDAGTRTLTSQSWDGKTLTWSYTYSDQAVDNTITISTVSLSADRLTANYSTNGVNTHQLNLIRAASSVPDYYSLPYRDDFSDPNSGWSIYTGDSDSAGYSNGTYFVISKTNQYSSYGSADRFFGNTVIDVDVTPLSGPAPDKFNYNVGCRNQSNGDGYIFEVEGDGYYAVGYYTGGGKTYKSLQPGSDAWVVSGAIHPGPVSNHLTVTCAGDQLKLAINGQQVFQTQDSTFIEGDISLGAATYAGDSTPAEVHFDNLLVAAP